MKISEFSIELCKENIMNSIDCYPNNPIYEEVLEEYEDMCQEAYDKLHPHALLAFGTIPNRLANEEIQAGTKVLYVITTVGGEMSEWSTRLFAEGNYLAGMLADAIADDYLFQVDHSLKEEIIKMCKARNLGVYRRIEAPTGISMEAQKVALEATHGKEELGIEINQSFMYNPVKTTCQIYLLKENSREYHIEHNCRECAAIHCKFRKVKPVNITVLDKKGSRKIWCKEQQSIQQALTENGIFISAVCGGRGTCGKCKVRLLAGELPPSREDEKELDAMELKRGLRLSCKAYPKMDCTISLETADEEGFVVVSEYAESGATQSIQGSESLGIGIDIGSTTIAMQLIDRISQKIIDTYTCINKQRAYGADVISRMEASNGGEKRALQESIIKDLTEGMTQLLTRHQLSHKITPVEQIVMAGNTTMIHLLMGYSCEKLGVFPFTPVNIDSIYTNYEKLLEDKQYQIPITILPGISTFVGGDITSGLLACDFEQTEDVAILIDLGTNGEMAIGNKDRILVTSTAAGPAFEGGNITCGTGSIEGAICGVRIQDGTIEVQTIGEKPPVGICGTGVMEAVLEMRNAEIIDDTGLLEEDYFEGGYLLAREETGREIVLSQKDIREIQLAKAAVRAGLETLLLRYGVSKEQVKIVYLAGGFGFHVNVAKAIGIGLLPRAFHDKIKVIGNSSLKGALQYLTDEMAADRMKQLIDSAIEINLSNDKDFNELYMDSMYFEET